MYRSMSDLATGGVMTYLLMAETDSGTRVKILSESKSRSLSCMRSIMACFELSDTA